MEDAATLEGDRGRTAILDAAAKAPRCSGIYVFLGGARDVLYVGKAGNLRRRLQQHGLTGAPTSHLHERYDRVREIVWEVTDDEEAAAWREADLIFALRPPFNADPGLRSRDVMRAQPPVPFLVVTNAEKGMRRFSLESGPPPAGGLVYGCFPHLGKGVSSRLGIACSDGYVAFLRLLWAASGHGSHVPSVITRSAPPNVELAVRQSHARGLHAFLSGVSPRLLDDLAVAVEVRPAYMRPALSRDRAAALGFFAAGPRLLRTRRLRHRLAPGAVPPDRYRELVIAELRDAVGALALHHP